MSYHVYANRRQRLLARLGDGVAIVPTAHERLRNRDSHYPYRFDSYFWYLSGFPEPDAVMVLVGGAEPRAMLFCREKDEEREIWDGFRYGPAGAAETFRFDEAYPIDTLDERLPEIANRDVLAPLLKDFRGQPAQPQNPPDMQRPPPAASSMAVPLGTTGMTASPPPNGGWSIRQMPGR